MVKVLVKVWSETELHRACCGGLLSKWSPGHRQNIARGRCFLRHFRQGTSLEWFCTRHTPGACVADNIHEMMARPLPRRGSAAAVLLHVAAFAWLVHVCAAVGVRSRHGRGANSSATAVAGGRASTGAPPIVFILDLEFVPPGVPVRWLGLHVLHAFGRHACMQ